MRFLLYNEQEACYFFSSQFAIRLLHGLVEKTRETGNGRRGEGKMPMSVVSQTTRKEREKSEHGVGVA
jgi:hypothetical protein